MVLQPIVAACVNIEWWIPESRVNSTDIIATSPWKLIGLGTRVPGGRCRCAASCRRRSRRSAQLDADMAFQAATRPGPPATRELGELMPVVQLLAQKCWSNKAILCQQLR
jgi:hypothetical protein